MRSNSNVDKKLIIGKIKCQLASFFFINPESEAFKELKHSFTDPN